MFKSEFGLSPKEARELGWQGVRHSTWLSIDQPIEEVGNLSNLLINNSLGLSLAPRDKTAHSRTPIYSAINGPIRRKRVRAIQVALSRSSKISE
jgi:hypothetical protein